MSPAVRRLRRTARPRVAEQTRQASLAGPGARSEDDETAAATRPGRKAKCLPSLLREAVDLTVLVAAYPAFYFIDDERQIVSLAAPRTDDARARVRTRPCRISRPAGRCRIAGDAQLDSVVDERAAKSLAGFPGVTIWEWRIDGRSLQVRVR